ncbi:MAG: DUF4878 domain-containing protein, partial [Bacteroidales bacterium]
GSSNPSNTIKDFCSAISQQDEQKALSYIYFDENNKLEKALVTFFINMAIQQEYNFKDFKTISKEITNDGKSAVVVVETLITKKGKEVAEKDVTTYELVKIDNKWLISGMKANK